MSAGYTNVVLCVCVESVASLLSWTLTRHSFQSLNSQDNWPGLLCRQSWMMLASLPYSIILHLPWTLRTRDTARVLELRSWLPQLQSEK